MRRENRRGDAAQGKVPISQGAPSSRGLPQTLPMQQSSQPREPVPVLPQPTVTNLRGMPGLHKQAAAIQAALQQDTNNTVLQGSCNKQSLKSGRGRIDRDTAISVANAIVGCRIDYCNSLLYGVHKKDVLRLQRVQNTLSRIVTRSPKYTSSEDLRKKLH